MKENGQAQRKPIEPALARDITLGCERMYESVLFSDTDFDKVRYDLYKLVKPSVSGYPQQVDKSSMHFLLSYLGLEAEKTTHAWDQAHSSKTWETHDGSEKLQQNYFSQFSALCYLETTRPGSARVLADEFSLYNFGRYVPFDQNPSLLVNQYDLRDDSTIPYGVLFAPRDDHNNANWRLATIMNDIQEALGEDYALRVYEVGKKYDVVKALIQADRRYGKDGNKISFAIAAMHGSEQGVKMGRDAQEGKITTDDAFFTNDKWQERVQATLDQNATIIFKSCSTGAEDGIASLVADTLQRTTIAPENDIDTTTIKSKKTSGGCCIFDVTYADNKGILTPANPNANRVTTKIYPKSN